MRRRQISRVMAAALAAFAVLNAAGPLEAQAATGQAEGLAAQEKYVVMDPEAYETLEVLALYRDGSVEVYSCDSREELEETIEALAEDGDVAVVQPDYTYEEQALPANDTSVGEQWALYNDGSFEIEVEKNRYPVYDDPFGTPSAPGEWGGHGRNLVGILVEVERQKAMAGIDINVAEAWEKYGGGTHDAIVALIDTGIDYTHEDLQGALWTNDDEIPGNGIDDDGNGYVDDIYGWNFYHNSNQVFTGAEDSHGTHGTGTIRASVNNGIGIAGIVPGNRVRVMALKALGGNDGGGSTSSLIRAIRYAEDNGAVICNLSLTSSRNDQALYQAIANSSMLFVVAAGNGDSATGLGLDTDKTPCYPAAYDLDNILSVANMSLDGFLHESSNYGAKTVDLAAPGTQILSTTPGSSYGYMTGTSMAAPMAAGAAAMVYSYFEGIGVADVKEILMATVTPLESLSGKTVTGGLLNVGAALSYDLNNLSRSGFGNSGSAPEGGTAPYIESQILDRKDGMYLTVRIVDVDGDLEIMLYSEGEHTAEEFENGLASVPFAVGSKDTVVFRIDDEGVYTFYARDSRGNATVRVVKFAPMSKGPGYRQQ